MLLLKPENLNSLAEFVKLHRKKSKMSQQMLADIAGIGRASIQRIEKNHPFEFQTLIKVLNVLNIKIIFHSPLTSFKLPAQSEKMLWKDS